jgi:rhodanese-related sulfurtransferase
MKTTLLIVLLSLFTYGKELVVKIQENLPYVEVENFFGNPMKVQRIQDTQYKLTDDYTKTSRECPPFCIQPMQIDDDIKNIEELEILTFMQKQVKEGTGVIVDARLSNWYKVETIPTAINIPFNLLETASKEKVEAILTLLGMKIKADGSYDYTGTKELVIFCNGVWCEQSKAFVTALLKYNYPKEKLYYYRSGFQGWKILGLTTVVHE